MRATDFFGGEPMALDITEILTFAIKQNASDVQISAGLPPMVRVDGDLRRLKAPPLEPNQALQMVHSIMNDRQRKHYEEFMEVDFSFEIADLARFRVNAFNQSRGPSCAIRIVPTQVASLADLGFGPIFQTLSMQPNGLVLVVGPAGTGKSTTLAAMVDHINSNRHEHILTVEDPIEFVHPNKKCLISQREVHRDTLSFNNALRSGIRANVDVMVVGEMRDLETIRLAITAAETGALVFATLHTNSASKTVDRIIGAFPADEQNLVQTMLSESLRAVIAQVLLKRQGEGGGRVAAHEIMVGTPAVRNLIREGKVAQMYSAIQTGQQAGMQTLDQALLELCQRQIISRQVARAKAKLPENF